MTTYLTDSWTRRDQLRFSDFRPALAAILTGTQTPLTLGIFGPWGCGKTSLLRMLKEDLDNQADHQVLRTVWFTAWKYDRHEALWRAFILRVLDGLYPREGDEGPWEGRPRVQEPTKQQQRLIEKLQRLEESVYRPVDWEELGRLTADWSRLLPEMGAAAGTLAAAFIPGGEFIRRSFAALAGKEKPELEEAASAIHREVRRYHREQLTSMEQFEVTFREALELHFGRRKKYGRLVVFVDDLDRCLPEKAVEILEAIKLFLEVPGTIFVLGMDEEIIERGIEARYGALLATAAEDGGEPPITGSEFLHKIIQIPFQLPSLAVDELNDYIEGLDAEPSSKLRLTAVTREVFARGVLPNPRQVKRVLNIFWLLRDIALKREETKRLPHLAWPLLAKTVLIQTQWPELYRQWRERPTLVKLLEEEYGRRPAGAEEIISGSGDGGAGIAADSLLYPYLTERRKYALLERMLAYPEPPPEPEPGKKKAKPEHRARFADLDPSEIEEYLRLSSSVKPQDGSGVSVPRDLLAELTSGDPAKIREAKERLEEADKDTRGPTHEAVRGALLGILGEERSDLNERVSAGDALALLGDPRFDPETWYLPAEPLHGFVEFSGNGGAEQTGQPPRESFYIGRFPVTVGQFQSFVKDSGQQLEAIGNLEEPANCPVASVSWFEAKAYCDWLQDKLIELAGQREQENQSPSEAAFWDGLAAGELRVTLPTGAEWKRAAAGGRGGVFPWGDEFDTRFANTRECGLRRITAVGCFPGGNSHPHGCTDFSGNVWEWTDELDEGELQQREWRRARGGSFFHDQKKARLQHSTSIDPDEVSWSVGFRLAVARRP